MHFDDIVDVFEKHPGASIIWAHTGLGRFVAPAKKHVALLDEMLSDSRYDHVLLDLSWDEVAVYVVQSEVSISEWKALLEKHPTRFLFGTDAVAPKDWDGYIKTYDVYQPLFEVLDDATKQFVLKTNYETVFDTAAANVREWENSQLTL